MSKPLRGGIIGCGFFGQIQLEAWSRMEEAEIVAACDLNIERARASAPEAYADAAEMLQKEDLDFIDIATRPDSHLPLVRLAASHKLPVICQKPMAPNWQDAVAMVETAEAGGIRLMIHENWRWQPWFREARRRIHRGEIGRPLAYRFEIRQRDGLGDRPYPNQPYFAEMPRLLIYEAMVHQIDTARFLFGDVVSVFARIRSANPIVKGEDQALVSLAHANGELGLIDGNRYGPTLPPGPAMGPTRIDGEDGTLVISSNGDIFAGESLEWRPPRQIGYKGDCARATQVHFVECLNSGEAFESGGREYLRTFAVVEAAYESAASGSIVEITKWN